MSEPSRPDSNQLYTLAEAARLTGLTVDALRKRASRGKLDQLKGNDGTVRVRLTTADLASLQQEMSGHWPSTASQESPSDGRADQLAQAVQTLTGELAGLKETLAAERETLARERARADQAEVREVAIRARLDQVEESRTLAERGQAEEAAALRERLGRAEGEAVGLRDALAEARRPAWRRWLGM